MKLTFLGATRTVTGSKYFLETEKVKFLVDCGLFQGLKEIRQCNWNSLDIKVKDLDAILLTHAHIDHSGFIPRLVKEGFKGKVFCTPATFDLCKILLPDSGYLQEEDARFANKYKFSKHDPALPLYTKREAEKALEYFEIINFHEEFVFKDIKFIFRNAGHILGAAIITITYEDKKTITFSGDLGRLKDDFMNPPEFIEHSDYVVMESTYGDREHEDCIPKEKVKDIINETVGKGGSVIIPAFAVGRAQHLIYILYQLKQEGSIPDAPIFLDSPMAVNATDLLCRYFDEHVMKDKKECLDVCSVVRYTRSVDDSKKIDSMHVPLILISASGMLEGGRILHHLKKFMVRSENTLFFTGYQARGTRGQRIQQGEKEIKIHGEYYPVKCRVEKLCSLSAHADSNEIIEWLSHLKSEPKKIFLTHGEAESSFALSKKIKEKLGFNAIVPEYKGMIEI